MRRIWVGLACGAIALSLIELRSSAVAQDKNSVVWLVRHAEKQQGKDGVWVLSKEGWRRAQDLADLLKDKGITTIVTTNEVRTSQTASKVAELKQPAIEPNRITYPQAKHAELVASAVRAAQPNVLVVGHSDTVLDIIAALRGQKGQKKTVDVFNRIFTVELDADKNVVTCSETTYGMPKMQPKKKNC